MSFYHLSLCIVTKNTKVLIVYRILRVAHNSKSIGDAGHTYRTTRIIAESGILYTLTSVLNLVASLSPIITFGEVADAIVCPFVVCLGNDYNLFFRTSQWQELHSILS